MSQVPARLVYDDGTDPNKVIGRFLPQDVTEGSISTFTIEENAADYTRVIIEGEPNLQQEMPTSLNEFGTSEPEIRVEIDENQNGTWTERARVYPEKAGNTDERGRYKNKNLWGFKKYYGEDDVEVTSSTNGPITTNIEDAVDALLPSGYTAVYPSDETPPSVSNYTYRGARQQAFKEIQEDYDHFIFFTTATDGNGDRIVRVQPTGYGGVVTSITRGQDTLYYDYWEKNDLSNVVSKARVIGTDSSGDKVDETFEAGIDDLSDLPEPDRERFRLVHVDFTINSSDAEEIARGIIDPEGTEHGAIESDLRPQSTLNESIGILDDSRNIDDVFTVVKQKDYLHQGVTYYSFEFERESTKEERNKWREHDNERAKIYPESTQQETVGPLDIDDTQTDTEEVSEQYDADSQNNHEHGNSNTTSDVGQIDTEAAVDSPILSDSSWADDASKTTTVNDVSYGGNQFVISYAIDTNDGFGNDIIVQLQATESGLILMSETKTTNNGGNIEGTYMDQRPVDGEDIEMTIVNKSGGTLDLSFANFIFVGEAPHDHFVNIAPTDGDTADLTINVNTSDSTAGDTSQLTVSGQTLDEIIDIITSQEDKTDR